MPCKRQEHYRLDRRTFLAASGLGFGGLHLPSLVGAAESGSTAGRKRAKSTILIWLSGGPSHIDLWDMKPDAPSGFRGEFKPVETSAPGVMLCEHMPHLAKQAHHLAVVRSVGHYGRGPNDHHPGYYYNLTGHPPGPAFPNSRQPLPDD